MNIYTIRSSIEQYLSGYKNGYNNTGATRWLEKNNPELWAEIVSITSFLPASATPKQRCWHILNDKLEIVLTIDTGRPARWFGSKYFMFSKRGAANKNSESNQKRKNTWLKKYGVGNPAKSAEIQDKIKATVLERYGAENYFASTEGIDRLKQDWSDPSRRQSRIDNIALAWQKKYGCHISQVPEIQAKQQKFKTRKYTLPSGKQVNIQGYEDRALDELLPIYGEDDLLIGSSQTPKITYVYDGKKRIYFPDIYIISKNQIVEVKSTWTFKIDEEKNLAKEKASVDQGFLFAFMIYSS